MTAKSLFWPFLLVVVLAGAVMYPRLVAPNFGFIDDGVALRVCAKVIDELGSGEPSYLSRIGLKSGRFRPVKWAYLSAFCGAFGREPFGFFLMLGLSLALTALSLGAAVFLLTGDRLAAGASGAVFVLATPVPECFFTIAKDESPLVLWLSLSLLFLAASVLPNVGSARARVLTALSAIFAGLAFLTKETAHVLVAVSAVWYLGARWIGGAASRVVITLRNYVAINVFWVAFFWIARVAAGTYSVSSGGYSRGYSLNPQNLIDGGLQQAAWYIRDFSYVLPIGLFLVLAFRRTKLLSSTPAGNLVLASLVWIAGWSAIMLPWAGRAEYYLLPSALGISCFAGIGVSAICSGEARRSLKRPALVLGVTALLGLVASSLDGYSNGRIQVFVDSVNAELMHFLADRAPRNARVVMVLPKESESVTQLRLLLADMEGRSDLEVVFLDPDTSLATERDVLIVAPISHRQPFPSVRIAISEPWLALARERLAAWMGSRWTRIYRSTEKLPLTTFGLERLACPIISASQSGYTRLHCASGWIPLDKRVFEYGWEVFAVGDVAR